MAGRENRRRKAPEICPVCGEDLNERPHAHDEAVDPRWTALQELKDKIAKR